jgi:hypothetical protein
VKFFLKNLFKDKKLEPTISFGRFSDYYKSKERYEKWDEALALHEKKQYFKSALSFLNYLENENGDNVEIIHEHEEKLKFSLCQGSKLISGFINQDGFFVEAKIAKCTNKSLPVLRSLLEENYYLRYSSFAIDSEENLVMVMHTDFLDASPYKLYYGLKELATRADRRDDALVQKYSEDLTSIRNGKIYDLADDEKNIKCIYLKNLIEKTIKEVEQNVDRLNDYPGLIAYKILGCVFLIDYLVKPEGLLIDLIENVHKIFFTSNTMSAHQKNAAMIKELSKVQYLEIKELKAELYDTCCTFGNMIVGNHIRLIEMVDMDLKHFNWYEENGYRDFVLDIPKYIAGLLLYTYAMPLPDKRYLHLLIRVLENDFFISLGYNSLIDAQGKISQKEIKEILSKIDEECLSSYHPLEFDVKKIDFSNQLRFSESFLRHIASLTIKKI